MPARLPRASMGHAVLLTPPKSFHLKPLLSPTVRLHKSFSCNTYEPPRKCCKQKTYGRAKPFTCNTYKKPRGGLFFPFWNSYPAWRQPFVSITYALPILQPFCFHIHACNGGCTPLAVLFSQHATRMKARNLARPHPPI